MSTADSTSPFDPSRKRKHAADDPPFPHKRSRSSSAEENTAGPKRRTVGPTLPPADLSTRPTTNPNDSDDNSSSSDDDFGPAPPPAPGTAQANLETTRQRTLAEAETRAQAASTESNAKPAREEWMLVPPSADGLSSQRMDPTKLKNRKFNSGKGAKAPGAQNGGDSEIGRTWTETPEQKRQRLADEMMGVKRPAQLADAEDGARKEGNDRRKMEEAREAERRIREFNEKNRGGSLVAEHQKGTPKEKEDDPSARAFDKEKDMKLGAQVGYKQKKEMFQKASDMGSRFSGGSYL